MANLRFVLTSAAVATLAACGGGGDDSGFPPPVVTASSAGSAVYSQTLVITLQGNNLDQPLGLSSAGCRNPTLGNTAPTVSTPTTAYIRCTVSGVGAQTATVTRNDGGTVATVAFTVAVPQVTMSLSNGAGVNGSLVVTLDPARAPATVDNFLNYVNSGFYAGTVLHRHEPGFVLQGGGYTGPLVPNGTIPPLKATNAPIALEDNAGLSNLRYTVAMARTEDINSATSQFFINLANNTGLDRNGNVRGYAVFGTVSGNTALVDAATAAPCASWPAFLGTRSCLPTPNITITGAVQTR